MRLKRIKMIALCFSCHRFWISTFVYISSFSCKR